MADEIIYRGGELDSFTITSGTGAVSTAFANFDADYSDCGIVITNAVYTNTFSSTISPPDSLWGMMYLANTSGSNTVATVFDVNGRPCVRLFLSTGATIFFQHNTSANATPAWSTLAQKVFGARTYLVFKIKFGTDGEYALYTNGDLSFSGNFDNTLPAPLASFSLGTVNSAFHLSQIQFSRNVSLVGDRVWTRKATGAGGVSEMTGTYTALSKTALNDATALSSSTAGQTSTFTYQDVTVPSGMIMDDEVWVWTRGKNDGSEPSSMKVVGVTDSGTIKSADMPFDVGYKQMPVRFTGYTPTKWNDGQIGLESTAP